MSFRKKIRKGLKKKKTQKVIEAKTEFKEKKQKPKKLNLKRSRFGKTTKNDEKIRRVIRYKKKRCDFIVDYKEGKPVKCKRLAVGKGTLCDKHGGSRIVKETLLTPSETRDIISYDVTTKFKPDFHPVEFLSLSRAGKSPAEIAAEFEVSVGTMKQWAEKYEQFAVVWEIGEAMHEAWWLEVGKGGLRDTKFNASLFKFLTGNKLGYSDKIEQRNMNTNVHGVLVIPDQMTEDEWEKQNMEDTVDAEYTEVHK